MWTLTVSTGSITETRSSASFTPDTQKGCNFVDGASSSIDANGRRYLDFTIALVVEDREGLRSNSTTRSARLYPDGACGFSF
jgi:hypothetical protein